MTRKKKAEQDDTEQTQPTTQWLDEELIGEFCKVYTYTPYEFDADEVFNNGKLRDYFNCWLVFGENKVDYLLSYIERLESLGYKRIVGCEGEPVIPVKRKPQRQPDSFEELSDD